MCDTKICINNVPKGHQAKLPEIIEAYSINQHAPVLLDEGVGIKILGEHEIGTKIEVLDGVYATTKLAVTNDTIVIV